MPCRNADPYLREAIDSTLQQPECLELLVADGGSTDGSIQWLTERAVRDPRLRIVSRSDGGPADALNRALRRARGTLIGWLNADDILVHGALARAQRALEVHPEWLMVYGEGEEFNTLTGLRQRYPTLPPTVGIDGFRSHCIICQPTVVFRRSMAVLLGSFDTWLQTAFDFDYWLRAFSSFPTRIGYIPQLQARTRLHSNTITSLQRRRVAMEATALLARYLGIASAARLHSYALELQLALAELPSDQSLQEHLNQLTKEAEQWLDPDALRDFRTAWLLDPRSAPIMVSEEKEAADLDLPSYLPVRLLQALRPELLLDAVGSPLGSHRRLQIAIQQSAGVYPLLRSVPLGGEALPQQRISVDQAIPCFSKRPFGVNLIGHAYEIFGIGEDIRMAARALRAADVPCCVIHLPAANGSACLDHSLDPLVISNTDGGPYAFNLVCMSAPSQARWLLMSGLEPLYERYTLAAWPWETRQWPKAWMPLFEVVDELWPSSHFTAFALKEPAEMKHLPVHVMPMAAEVSDPDRFRTLSARLANRERHSLPKNAVIVAFSFDFNSTAIRKNPMGALEAFQLAFPLPELAASYGQEMQSHPLSDQVALMIKVLPFHGFSPEWNWLKLRAAEDSRIHLICDNLERDELQALFGCCDIYLSLHRSEGFGRGIAEALQLGLDVIATAYGGNTDFCMGPLAHPTHYQEVPIPKDTYPHGNGHLWAEPDIDHAASLLRQQAAARLSQVSVSASSAWNSIANHATLDIYRQRFSVASAGLRYRARLEQLWADRSKLETALKWKAQISAHV